MDNIISIKNFSMNFGKTKVIKNLSFDIHRGETFGLLGSNGCGKTTIIRALLGIYIPTSGSLEINGQPYAVNGTVKLGYLPEERGLYKKETVIDVMTYFGQLKGLSKNEAYQESMDFLKLVRLDNKANLRIEKLSGGQQQKVQLGITIMNKPELLILDEPTKGFDPVNRKLLMDIIETHQKNGTTVVIVTHQMEEVERLCDRIILLKDGRAHAYGSVNDIKKKYQNKSLNSIFLDIYGDENNEDEPNV